jgi:hypothetical protein
MLGDRRADAQPHSLQDANIVRGELGLPEVPVAAPPSRATRWCKTLHELT